MKPGYTSHPDYYCEMRSPIDNAIVDLLLRVSDEKQVRLSGLKIRHFRYVFGGYLPRDPERYRWLDSYRGQQLKLGVVKPDFRRYSPQVVWNHCRKLSRMGILSERDHAYKLNHENLIFSSPSRLPYLRKCLKNARQEECMTTCLVTLVGVRKTIDQGLREKDIQEWFMDGLTKEAERFFREANERWARMKWRKGDELVLPLVVIDFSNMRIHNMLQDLERMKFG